MISWPDKLVEAIARKKSVLYLGSGISANAKNKDGKRPATWESFLRLIIANHSSELASTKSEIEELLDRNDYLTACEILVNLIGQDTFGDEAANEFRRPAYAPAEIHHIIFGLDSKIVITPNVDKIYDECASTESHSTVVIKCYNDSDIAKYLRTEDYLIIKAHGTVDNPSEMIFTHGQYSKARCQYAAFYRLLDSLILTHTFVFLGCGISDPDIELVLENSNFVYDGCQPHYFVAPSNTYSDSMKKVLLNNRNIQIVEYDNSDGTHNELFDGLKSLKEMISNKKDYIATNYKW